MKIVGERLRGLREGLKLSQAKIGKHVGTTQSSINRYEKNVGDPPFTTLLWYADYFDVSIDYICGRTSMPEGKFYTGCPKIGSNNEEIHQFIEMCFDPKNKMSVRLKDTLRRMIANEEGK